MHEFFEIKKKMNDLYFFKKNKSLWLYFTVFIFLKIIKIIKYMKYPKKNKINYNISNKINPIHLFSL